VFWCVGVEYGVLFGVTGGVISGVLGGGCLVREVGCLVHAISPAGQLAALDGRRERVKLTSQLSRGAGSGTQ